MSGGRLGYIHVPDMGAPGLREFIKWYYPQLNKEGMVIDVRANGGGNVSRMLIERLRRKVLGVNYRRADEEGGTYPDGAFLGPMVAILNENSASDGDIFPYMFREAGLSGQVGRVETARQVIRQALSLGLPEPAHHVRLWRNVTGRIGLRELACNKPAAARGKGTVDLGRKSPPRSVRAPLGEDCLVEPGNDRISGLQRFARSDGTVKKPFPVIPFFKYICI